jgi:TPR repeat protein
MVTAAQNDPAAAKILKSKRGPTADWNYMLKVIDRAEGGEPHALNGVADMYYDGRRGEDYAKAFALYMEAAEAGVTDRLERIGDMYAKGQGTAPDAVKAREYWLRAAASYEGRADHWSAYSLGQMYLAGKGVVKDTPKGLAKLEEAGASDNRFALDQLGDMYFDGSGVEKDEARALAYYLRAVEAGSDRRFDRLAAMYAQGRGTPVDQAKAASFGKDAVDALSKTAASDSWAAYRLGMLYLEGAGVPRNPQEALRLLKVSAAAGRGDAMIAIADLYYDGTFGAPDYRLALDYYDQALKAGKTWRSDRLGDMYAHGLGTAPDLDQAHAVWREAIARSKASGAQPGYLVVKLAQSLLASGQPAEAHTHLSEAAAAGHRVAAAMLGDMYYAGQGVPRDPATALRWYLQAEQAGEVSRLERIGDLYEGGDGLTHDLRKAQDYWRRAAEEYRNRAATDHWAAYALGRMYRDGKGVPQDSAEARRWLADAARAGNQEAIKAVAAVGTE